jgi:hypothetical protein
MHKVNGTSHAGPDKLLTHQPELLLKKKLAIARLLMERGCQGMKLACQFVDAWARKLENPPVLHSLLLA